MPESLATAAMSSAATAPRWPLPGKIQSCREARWRVYRRHGKRALGLLWPLCDVGTAAGTQEIDRIIPRFQWEPADGLLAIAFAIAVVFRAKRGAAERRPLAVSRVRRCQKRLL